MDPDRGCGIGCIEIKNFDAPDETRPSVGKGPLEIVSASREVGRGMFEPGWRWSENVIAPGRDAEVVGDEACVMLDVGEEDADYAKRA